MKPALPHQAESKKESYSFCSIYVFQLAIITYDTYHVLKV